MRNFFLQPGFTEQTELWRRHTSSPGTMSDVYDGNAWSEFLNLRGHPFLSLPYNLALSPGFSRLNILHTLLVPSTWPFKTCLEVKGMPVTTSFL